MKFDKKKVLIIGFGSIGQRHFKILNKMSVKTYIYSKRNINIKNSFCNLKNSLNKINYDYIIIANKTSEHLNTLKKLKKLNYKGIILIEKPIFDKYIEFDERFFKRILVAFNLRFHPIIQYLKKKISREKILSVNAYVGQYLPYWRPKKDYKKTYSAIKKYGGGVLLDLSHEIDYLNWTLNGFSEVNANGGKTSNLKIDSDDLFQISLKSKKCNFVQLELNYLDKILRRFLIVNTINHSYKIDLVANTLEIDGKIKKFNTHKNMSYKIQHKHMLKKNFSVICNYKEALMTMKIIDSIKQSNKKKNG
tara:strand:- start:884 stop:1801 length:918 start_codon:yes stop_codon:yes gene_type:complete